MLEGRVIQYMNSIQYLDSIHKLGQPIQLANVG